MGFILQNEVGIYVPTWKDIPDLFTDWKKANLALHDAATFTQSHSYVCARAHRPHAHLTFRISVT